MKLETLKREIFNKIGKVDYIYLFNIKNLDDIRKSEILKIEDDGMIVLRKGFDFYSQPSILVDSNKELDKGIGMFEADIILQHSKGSGLEVVKDRTGLISNKHPEIKKDVGFLTLKKRYENMLIEAAKEIFIEEVNNLTYGDSITEICDIWDDKNRFNYGSFSLYNDLYLMLKEVQREFNKVIVENTMKHKEFEYIEGIIKSL